MTRWARFAAASLLVSCVTLGSVPAPAQEDSCAQIAAQFDAQQRQLASELRRIQREIAALRAEIESPGLREAFAGIGYILGVLGVAFFVAARRKR